GRGNPSRAQSSASPRARGRAPHYGVARAGLTRLPAFAMSGTTPRGRDGFTVIELLIAMVVGVVVFMSATGILLATFRAQAGSDMREELARNSRFLGEVLQRDLSEAGVDLRSTATFGSVDVRNDTISALSVPFDRDEAPAYRIAPPAGSPNPLPAG